MEKRVKSLVIGDTLIDGFDTAALIGLIRKTTGRFYFLTEKLEEAN